MAITVSDEGDGYSAYGSTDPFTGSSTFSANANDIVLVCIYCVSSAATITSVTSHGQSLSRIRRQAAADRMCEVWGRLMTGTPGSGTTSIDHSQTDSIGAQTLKLTGTFSGHTSITDAVVSDIGGSQYEPTSEWQIGTLGSGDVTIVCGTCTDPTMTAPSGYSTAGNVAPSGSGASWYDGADTTPTLAFTGSVFYDTMEGIAIAIDESAAGGGGLPAGSLSLLGVGI